MSVSFCPALVTVPITIPRGKSDGSSPFPAEPAVTIREGLGRTIEWFRTHADIVT